MVEVGRGSLPGWCLGLVATVEGWVSVLKGPSPTYGPHIVNSNSSNIGMALTIFLIVGLIATACAGLIFKFIQDARKNVQNAADAAGASNDPGGRGGGKTLEWK